MSKKTVAVIFGSRSAEHDVSIVTAIGSIIKPLMASKQFNVVPVYIAKNGAWYSEPELLQIETFTSGAIDAVLQKRKPVGLLCDGSFTLVKTGFKSKQIQIDVVFPATHGTYGEDGALMGLLDMANVPYVGCDMESSVISMDKSLAKTVVMAHRIDSTKFYSFSAWEYAERQDSWTAMINDNLQYPLFVKPVHLGSSIGITRVASKDDLQSAIEVALYFDDKVLVEEAVRNVIEVTVPIMGNEQPRVAMVEQPLTKAEDFFNFETKYMQGGKKGKNGAQPGKQGAQGYSKIPADIPTVLYNASVDTALAVYRAVGCSGIARVDLLIDGGSNKVYFNEINPLPGSLYSHNWNRAGIANVELVKQLIELALERHERKSRLNTAFETNYLKQFF